MLFGTLKDAERHVLSDPASEIERLRAENADLKAMNQHLNRELEAARDGIVTPSPDKDGENEEAGPITEEALRKRLERLCKKDRQGCPCSTRLLPKPKQFSLSSHSCPFQRGPKQTEATQGSPRHPRGLDERWR